MPPSSAEPAFPEPLAGRSPGHDRNALRVRRYTTGVTVAMIVLCNAVFLFGIWISGVNLERLIRIPDLFDPVQDICLRLGWHRVAGLNEPVHLCSEWIHLSDPSGETHKFQAETRVVQGADGKLYFDHGSRVDYRLFVLAGFVVAVIALGLMLKHYLITRYRGRLETRDDKA